MINEDTVTVRTGSSERLRRLVLVVRADPVICGHSVEARNLAEVALARSFDEVHIVTWPIDRLQASGLPLKPLDTVLEYSPGITVHRPDPVGDYRVVDGRYLAGVTGRLVELFSDGAPTMAMSLYLSPHTDAVVNAVRTARRSGFPVDVTTVAEAVGSDITNVVRTCLHQEQFGAAAGVLSTYLDNDVCVAVSNYTRELIIESATALDTLCGTRFADECRRRVQISYPAIDAGAYLDLDPTRTERVLADRGLERDRYVLFLSRLAKAKGVDDLIAGFAASSVHASHRLVIIGDGPDAGRLHEIAAASPVADRIVFFDDVDDADKPYLMHGCAAYVLPSKPRPEFVETFGIALAEKMLAGGGPVITCDTGGIGEAVGDHAMTVPVEDPTAIAAALDAAIAMPAAERTALEHRARDHALQFDRALIFDRLLGEVQQRRRTGVRV